MLRCCVFCRHFFFFFSRTVNVDARCVVVSGRPTRRHPSKFQLRSPEKQPSQSPGWCAHVPVLIPVSNNRLTSPACDQADNSCVFSTPVGPSRSHRGATTARPSLCTLRNTTTTSLVVFIVNVSLNWCICQICSRGSFRWSGVRVQSSGNSMSESLPTLGP